MVRDEHTYSTTSYHADVLADAEERDCDAIADETQNEHRPPGSVSKVSATVAACSP